MSRTTEAEAVGGWNEWVASFLHRNPGWRRYCEECSRLLEEIARVNGVKGVTVSVDSKPLHGLDRLQPDGIGASSFTVKVTVMPVALHPESEWTYEHGGVDMLSAIRNAHRRYVGEEP